MAARPAQPGDMPGVDILRVRRREEQRACLWHAAHREPRRVAVVDAEPADGPGAVRDPARKAAATRDLVASRHPSSRAVASERARDHRGWFAVDLACCLLWQETAEQRVVGGDVRALTRQAIHPR